MADGHRTDYDIRPLGGSGYESGYWVPIDGKWYPVPPEAVITTDNPVGEAVVWYVLQAGGHYYIRCFVPAPLY